MANQTDINQEDDSLDLLISATAAPPAATKKVELDLDDAPFLQTEEQNLPAASHADVVPEDPDAEAERARKRKKRLLVIAAVCAVLLVGAGVGGWWFFLREPPVVDAGLEPEVIVVPSVPTDAQPSEYVRSFAPFIVPVIGSNGSVDFLVCKFSALTKDPKLNQEIEQQRTALRDAIYFYLRSKDKDFLLDASNGKAIKDDLMSVFSDYLTQGQLEDILFESYLSH